MSHSTAHAVEVIVFSLEGDDKKRQALYKSLNQDEKLRAARYRFDKHRHRFIIGRGTIREILSEKGKCPAQAIRFQLNSYGKPSVQEPESLRQIRFNASSSATLGAIAISTDIPMGLDIEKIKPHASQNYDLIVKNQFTDDEYHWYKEHGEIERVRAFFRLWTCKEAYLKALGIGLSGKLGAFTIDLRGCKPLVSFSDLEESRPPELSLYQFDITDEFIACLAVPLEGIQIYISHW